MQVYKTFLSKFAQAPLFLTFEQSFMSFTTKGTLHKIMFYKYFLAGSGSGSVFKKQLDPEPHIQKLPDPDPQKMSADPRALYRSLEK